MQVFEQYDPRNPQPKHQLLRFFKSPQEENNGTDFFFLTQDKHLLVYREQRHTYPPTSDYKPGQTELFANQFEMPLEAIRWLIDVIEQKFFKSPENGGLSAHKISYEEIVAGEDLHVMRSANAGCPHTGYVITNGSRHSHFDSDDLQTLALSDPWLFQNGLMDFLKELANKYEQGTL
ncbi:hypothetical protein D0C16_12675 [Cellvibrio sp. KY-GH-1]|uniref:hypothetical protein n=1 Tax=Cellvibrio sp. KY-GH-1 TaxID=2303332 RepID=UPI0012471589|nr:hypothetical protein [Cellvibrio sp. KY-GH-1]QEY16748.1 hypothetical protein D0C16_12675 [Cellvibrio sp. KY-GH-1]